MTKTLSEIKAEEGRDLDSSLAESTLVPGEGSNFGAFSLSALWNWIKGKFTNVVEADNMNAVTSNAVNSKLKDYVKTADIADKVEKNNKNPVTSNAVSQVLANDFPSNTTIFEWLKNVPAGTSCMVVSGNIPSDTPFGADEFSMLVAGSGARKTVIAFHYFDKEIAVRHLYSSDTKWRDDWQKLVTKNEIENSQIIREDFRDDFHLVKRTINTITHLVNITITRYVPAVNGAILFSFSEYLPPNEIATNGVVINEDNSCQMGYMNISSNGTVKIGALEQDRAVRGTFNFIYKY